MLVIDVYLRKPKHEINVYLNELTSETRLAAYNTLILHSDLTQMEVSTPVGDIESCLAIGSKMQNQYTKLVLEVPNHLIMDSALNNICSKKQLGNIHSGFRMDSSEMHLSFSRNISGNNGLGISSNLSHDNPLKKYVELSSKLSLETNIDTSKISSLKFISITNHMGIETHLSDSSNVYLKTDSKMGLGSSLTNMSAERYRKFGDLEGVTFGHLDNVNIGEFIIIDDIPDDYAPYILSDNKYYITSDGKLYRCMNNPNEIEE